MKAITSILMAALCLYIIYSALSWLASKPDDYFHKQRCIDGVVYIVGSHSMSVKYNTDGTVENCAGSIQQQ